jgi:hypothetical protein
MEKLAGIGYDEPPAALAGIYLVFLALWDKLLANDEAYRSAGYEGPSEHLRVTLYGEAASTGFYDNAYKLEATCVGEVFEILNIRHPEDYRRRSLSVGDIVVDPNGDAWIVKGMGWEKLQDTNLFSKAAREHDGDLRAMWAAHTAPLRARLAARRAEGSNG